MKQPTITIDPKILGGKPIIAGTRISVELILDRVTSGMRIDEIIKDYPHLTKQQIQAALSYAKILVRKKSSRLKAEPIILYTHEISR